MAKVRVPQPPGTKLSEDGQFYVHPTGDRTHVYKEESPSSHSGASSAPSGPPKVVGTSATFKKGDPMPKQAEFGDSFGEAMRKWREAQRAESQAGALEKSRRR